jgi:ATP-binding cassette subfamily F protein uup
VQEYVGGYADWVHQRDAAARSAAAEAGGGASKPGAPRNAGSAGSTSVSVEPTAAKAKLSYNERRELEQLPRRIEALETEQQHLESAIAHPEFYREPAETISQTLERLDEIRRDLSGTYARWDALDSRQSPR